MKIKPSKKRIEHILQLTSEFLREATKHYVFEVATPERVAGIEKIYTDCMKRYFGDSTTCKYDPKTSMITVSVTFKGV